MHHIEDRVAFILTSLIIRVIEAVGMHKAHELAIQKNSNCYTIGSNDISAVLAFVQATQLLSSHHFQLLLSSFLTPLLPHLYVNTFTHAHNKIISS